MSRVMTLSFIKRYYKLLLLAAVFLIATRLDEVFNAVGALMYLPALVTGAAATVLFLRNVFNAQTTDDHVDSGEFVETWKSLAPRERFNYTFWQWIAYFLGACIVAAALAN